MKEKQFTVVETGNWSPTKLENDLNRLYLCGYFITHVFDTDSQGYVIIACKTKPKE